MRKLATIQKIKSLDPITNADSIERATVLGWQLVVKKGEFRVGEACVYCEIDSLFPDLEPFAFLKPRGMRIRTVKLRGQISQGICFPLSILPEGYPIEEGADVTQVLGITKYEPVLPASLSGLVKGIFPSFIPKTDETRVQVLQELLCKYEGEACYVTEKLDGSSVTYYLKDGEFGVCSRNLELLETADNSFWTVARQLDMENKLRRLGGNYALQGELIGSGIQGNKYKLKTQTVYFFNAFDIDRYAYLDYEQFADVIRQLELNSVPVLDASFKLTADIEALVDMAIGQSVLNPAVFREGIVIRPLVEKNDLLGRVSFKAISPEFLLKYE
jgi:RNA ligase (TIGR02306 family)